MGIDIFEKVPVEFMDDLKKLVEKHAIENHWEETFSGFIFRINENTVLQVDVLNDTVDIDDFIENESYGVYEE